MKNDKLIEIEKALRELPIKAVQIDSFADCDTVSPFPLDNPTSEEQIEWLEEYCNAQEEHIKGLIEDIIEMLEGAEKSEECMHKRTFKTEDGLHTRTFCHDCNREV